MREAPVRVCGVLAVFDDRERVLAAVRRAKADGLLRLTAFAPAYDCELVETASPPSMLGIGWPPSSRRSGRRCNGRC